LKKAPARATLTAQSKNRESAVKPLTPESRRHANQSDAFTPFVYPDGAALGDSVLQPNTDRPLGEGFHLYRMPPGMTTRAHAHAGEEHFYVIEGDITDSDGRTFRKGDIVSYRDGTEHSSHTKDGCLLVVWISAAERSLE
jgi:quercetin dioxygenase-like cupin family protein